MEKTFVDFGMERDFKERHFEGADHYSASGTNGSFRQRKRTRNVKRRMIRASTDVTGGHQFMVMRNPHTNHLSFFKKIGKALGKVKEGIKKVALKVTPKPLRKIASKIIEGHEKVFKKVGQLATKLISYPLLVPLMPVMGAAIKKAGVSPSGDPGKRAEQFYTYVIKKEKPGSNYEQDHILPAIAALIPIVIKFVKNMIAKKKAKKAAGQEASMDPVEAVVADTGASVMETLDQKALNDSMAGVPQSANVLAAPLNAGGQEVLNMPQTSVGGAASGGGGSSKGGMKLSFKNPLVIGGIVLAIVVVFFLARRNA